MREFDYLFVTPFSGLERLPAQEDQIHLDACHNLEPYKNDYKLHATLFDLNEELDWLAFDFAGIGMDIWTDHNNDVWYDDIDLWIDN